MQQETALSLIISLGVPRRCMARHFQDLRRWLRDSRAATMAEYAMLIAVIALVVVVGARALGTSASGKLDNAATQIG